MPLHYFLNEKGGEPHPLARALRQVAYPVESRVPRLLDRLVERLRR